MKTKITFKIIVFVVVLLVLASTTIVIYSIGYQKGIMDEQIKRIPFDLENYLQMHEMGSFINSDAEIPKPLFRPNNAKMLIYSTLHFHEATKTRFNKIAEKGLRFDDNLEKGWQIVEDLELVSVKDVLESLKETSDGSNSPKDSPDENQSDNGDEMMPETPTQAEPGAR